MTYRRPTTCAATRSVAAINVSNVDTTANVGAISNWIVSHMRFGNVTASGPPTNICVLAAAGVGVAGIDPFPPRQGGHDLVVRPFAPIMPAVACMLWSYAQPLSGAARTFLQDSQQC